MNKRYNLDQILKFVETPSGADVYNCDVSAGCSWCGQEIKWEANGMPKKTDMDIVKRRNLKLYEVAGVCPSCSSKDNGPGKDGYTCLTFRNSKNDVYVCGCS